METVNALELRQSLGRVLRRLEKAGDPVLVKRGQKPAAVLISLRDYQERFVDRDADERRRAVVARLRSVRVATPRGKSTLDLLREIRAGRP